MKTVYVLDGDYLWPSFKKQFLYETRGDDTTSFSLWCNDVIQSHEIKVSSPCSGFNVVGCLHDFKKLSFISTVGFFVSNREIERMSTHRMCKDVIHSLFSFFMVLFCQVFSGFKLYQQFVPMVEFVDDKRVEYDSRFSVCGDGHELQTIKYETANNGGVDFNVLQHDIGQSLESVYKSPILDINIEIGSETNGYYPGCKDSYREHLFGKDIQAHRWQQQNRLKIVELSICMNFITIALGMSHAIFATKPPDHLVWKTFLLKMKKCVVTTVIQIMIHYVPLITRD